MTRRAFFATVCGVTTMAPAVTHTRIGLHVTGTLIEDVSDLQRGYFALCGSTGVCKATDALAVQVHPTNTVYLNQLQLLVGRRVQVSIFTV